MTVMQSAGGRGPSPTGLADVIETILDKGMVIDAYVRVSLVGIEVLTIDARVVVASVDTYLRFAEAVNRLDLTAVGDHATIQDLGREGAEEKTRGAIEGVKDEFRPSRGEDESEDGGREREKAGAKS